MGMKWADAESRADNSPQPAADACLWPLLSALDWVGETRQLSDALPDGHTVGDFTTLVQVLERLKYRTINISKLPKTIEEDMLPALIRRPDRDIWIVLKTAPHGKVLVFKGGSAEMDTVPAKALAGGFFVIRPAEPEQPVSEQGRFGWVSGLLHRERRLVRLLFGVTFIVNCLALSLPLYLLNVFNLAIGARSSMTLGTLAAGIAIMLIAEIALREIRARAIARFAVRIQMHVMASVFEQLLRLPVAYIESASVAGQLNRLRTFEAIRDIFGGPLATSLLDLPFIFVFVIAIFTLGGGLGWIILTFIGILTLLALAFIPRARASTHQAGTARSESRLFRMDMTRRLSIIRDCGAEAIWARRYRDLVARQLTSSLSSQHVNFVEQTLAQALSAITGALIVCLGAVQVIDGTLSMGALAAVMAIVWRVLAPIQTSLLNLNRVFQAVDTAKQINQLMKLSPDEGATVQKTYQLLRGDIVLENVGYRAGAQGLPILRGIDLQIRAGQLIVLAGAPGPSRSALLKIIANLYMPSVGRIRIDGCDVRQFHPRELHRSIAYVSDDQIIFSGSLAQNLLFANPLADDERVRRSIAEADLTEFAERLENGAATDLTPLLRTGMSTAISQKIRLARCYLQGPSIYLFDEPTKDLDPDGQKAFVAKIQSLKGQATIIIRTADPRLMNLADGVAYLQGGQLLQSRSATKGAAGDAATRNQDEMMSSGAA